MKKKLSLILLAVILVFASAFVFACSGVKKDDIFGDYGFTNPAPKEKTYDVDEGVVLDGKLTEPMWQGEKSWWTGVSSDGSKSNNDIMHGQLTPCDVEVTSHFTDKGAYFAAKVDDTVINVYREPALAVYQKTGISIYIADRNATTITDHAYELIFAVDGTSMLRRQYLGGYNNYPLSTVGVGVDIHDANLDEHGNGSASGYTMEIYIPWSAIGIDGKPDYVNAFFSTQRHVNTTKASQFGWENLCSEFADWGTPQSWLKFMSSGLYAPATPTAYTIDGDDEDWADYAGEVKRIDLFDGVRYIEYKMTRAEDGLYMYVEALQRLWLTGQKDWYRDTNIEVNITNKNGGRGRYYLNADQVRTANTFGVMKYVDKAVGDKTYKLITAEYFIPESLMKMQDIDVDAEELRAGLAFRNGTYQNAGDSLTEETNEVIEASSTAAVAKPFLWYAYGCNPFVPSNRMYVTENGIQSGVKANDKIIDGKFDDWSDYHGVDAVAYGRINVTDNNGTKTADKSAEDKGFKVKAIKGSDGVYVYATVRHSEWKTNDAQGHMNSNLAVGFALTNTNYTGNNDTLKWARGNEIFFTSIGSSYGPSVSQYIKRSDEKDAKGLYTTVIEGFIPYNQMFGNLANMGQNADEGVEWDKVFNTTTGEVADGYALRMGFQWRTREESIALQGRAVRNDWVPCIFESVPTKGAAWKFYFVDDNGLHQSRIAPASMMVDGNAEDWKGYSGATSRIQGSGASSDLWTESKAILKEDGLYTLTTAKMKHFTTCLSEDNAEGRHWEAWYKNTSVEIHYVNSAGNNAQFGWIAPFKSSVSGDIFDIDYVYNVTYDGEYYNITIEAFFNKNYVLSKTGGTEMPKSIMLGFAFGINYGGNITGATEADYVDYVNGTSGGKLFAGNMWSATTTSENGMYYATAAGLQLTYDESKTPIYESHVTDNVPSGGLTSDMSLEVTVKVGDDTLVKDTDYTLTVVEDNETGDCYYTVTGIGDYVGTVTRDYKLNIIDINDVEINVPASVEFGAKVEVTVNYNGEPVDPSNYVITIAPTDSIGEKTVTVTGKSALVGEKEINFEVVAKDIANGVTATVGTVLKDNEPTSITVTYGDITLEKDVDYTVEYSNYAEAGMGVATITAIGNKFTGTLVAEFVVLEQKRNLSDDGASATATAYAYYEPDATSFLPETLVVKYNNGTTEFTLHQGVDFTLGNVSYDGTDGGTATLTLVGAGLFEGEREVTYTVNHYRYFSGKNSGKLEVTYSQTETYTGEAITPTVTVTWDGTTLVADTDYTIEYADNINAGTATITVTAKGDVYKSAVEKTFTINPKSITGATVTVTDQNLKLTGKAITPNASVTLDGKALTKDTEFTISYEGDNKNLKSDKNEDGTYKYNYGEATLKVTGKGNYTGTATTTFRFDNPSTEKRLDGDAADWADYNGNMSIIVGCGNTHGVETKAWWGSDGLYIFAVARHNKLLSTDNEFHMNTNLAVEMGIVSADKSSAKNVGCYFFSINGVNNAGAVEAFKVTGSENAYVSYVEGFIPQQMIIDKAPELFTDGNLNDGYNLKLGFAWRTKGDDAPVFGTARHGETTPKRTEYWEPVYRHGYFTENYAKNEFYYIDKPADAINRGLRLTDVQAKERVIDGDTSDWTDYDVAAAASKVVLKDVQVGDGRYAKYRGYFGTDGLYVSVEALINTYVVGNYKLNEGWVQDYVNSWHKSTGFELHIKKSQSDSANDKAYNVVYGYNTTFNSSNALNNVPNTVESAVACKQVNGKCLVGVELFVPNKLLYAISGQQGVNPWVYNWTFGTNNADTDYFNTSETYNYVDGGSGTVGDKTATWGNKWLGGLFHGDVIKVWNPAE